MISVGVFLITLLIMTIIASIVGIIFIIVGLDKINMFMVGLICCSGVSIACTLLTLILYIFYYLV